MVFWVDFILYYLEHAMRLLWCSQSQFSSTSTANLLLSMSRSPMVFVSGCQRSETEDACVSLSV